MPAETLPAARCGARKATSTYRERSMAVAPRRNPVTETTCQAELGLRVTHTFEIVHEGFQARPLQADSFRLSFQMATRESQTV